MALSIASGLSYTSDLSLLTGLLNTSQLMATGAFASIPAASTVPAGKFYLCTDIGTGGTIFVSDGIIWRPAMGSCVLSQSAVGWSHTGDTADTSLVSYTVPAGIMTANGGLRISSLWEMSSNNANAKTCTIKFGSSAVLNANTANTIEGADIHYVVNQNSASSQIASTGNVHYGSGTTGNASQTFSINTANAVLIDFRCTLGVNTDTIFLRRYLIELIIQ